MGCKLRGGNSTENLLEEHYKQTGEKNSYRERQDKVLRIIAVISKTPVG